MIAACDDLLSQGDLAAPMLIFSAGISPRQRAILHAIAEESGLQHSSQGEGSSRRISVGGPGLQVGPPSMLVMNPHDCT